MATKQHYLLALLAAALLAELPQTTVAQQTHLVGDALGWIVPPGGPIAYSTWASLQTFSVGDILVFNFTTGQQDVARVTRVAFDSCNTTNPIWLRTTSPVNFTITSAGDYYFISTIDRHCRLGQRLAINVTVSSAGPSPSPAPHHPPSTPVPDPPRSPATYVVGDRLGWLVPPGGAIAYSTWAYGKTFFVGDTLVFNFTNGTQDVAVVTRSAYDTCDTNNTISVLTTPPVTITLSTAGEYFFTSTYPRHCALGQRLAINVTSAATAPEGSAMPPSGSATQSTHGPAGAPLPESSAPSRATIGLYATVLSIIVAFCFA